MKVVQRRSGPLVIEKKAPEPELDEEDDGGQSLTSITDVRKLRHAQQETNRRVEELRTKVFRITEHRMEQAINVLKGWLDKT